MRGDLYDKDGRFIGREGGLSQSDYLGRAIAGANAGAAGGGGQFTEEQNQQRQGNTPAPATAGDQLNALRGQQQANWAAQGFNDQAFANEGGRGGFRQSSWMGSPPASINMQSLAATNPNVLNNQNSAANQFAALDQAQAGVPANMQRDRVTVQGINGTNDYIRNSVTGMIEPAPASLDAISATNAARMPSIRV